MREAVGANADAGAKARSTSWDGWRYSGSYLKEAPDELGFS